METKEKEKVRTYPVSRNMRTAIEMTGGATKHERTVKGALNRYIRILKAQKAFDDYVHDKVKKDIIDKYNEMTDESKHIETLQLFSQGVDLGPGEYKLTFERRIKKNMDARAQMARSLVDSWLRDYEQQTTQVEGGEMVYNLLKGLFFSRNGFRWTQQLYQFLLMPESKIPDKRLREAQKLIKESIIIDKTNWYCHIWRYNEEQNDYLKVELEDAES